MAAIRGDAGGVTVFSEAAALIRSQAIQSDADLGPLLESPPDATSPDVLKWLGYMYDAGAWVLRESAIADLPADLRWLYESGAVTIEQLSVLHEQLGVTTIADLAGELRRRSIQRLPGFTPDVETAIVEALPGLRASIPRIPLGRATAIADPILARLGQILGPGLATPVGSLRRGEDTVGDIEIVAPAADATAAIDELVQLPDIARTLHRSARRLHLLIDRVQVGIRFPPPEALGAAMLNLTGSRAHLDALRDLAASRGWELEPEGLKTGGGTRIAESEDAIYESLGLPWIPPEIRQGLEAVTVAGSGALPTLVSRRDIRGDLHMHSKWSDGRDTIEDMVKTSIGLGYEYIAITDHSPHSAASRNLSADGARRQGEEIVGLRANYPQIIILHGCEVDILPSGRLDFPDKVLEQFDIVLASLHEGATHGRDQLFQRYLQAMRHPLVTLITHPTNRQVPQRPGYDLDYEQLFAAAVDTGTVVEIDGAPTHLDLNGAMARQAAAAGALIAIDSDCHRADMLGRQMDLGILMARSGWIEPRQVLNAKSIDEVRAVIASKRPR